jgi:hypothetical protein
MKFVIYYLYNFIVKLEKAELIAQASIEYLNESKVNLIRKIIKNTNDN